MVVCVALEVWEVALLFLVLFGKLFQMCFCMFYLDSCYIFSVPTSVLLVPIHFGELFHFLHVYFCTLFALFGSHLIILDKFFLSSTTFFLQLSSHNFNNISVSQQILS